MSVKFRGALGYLAAILVPLALATQWGRLSPVLQAVPAISFLLLVALIARFFGFRPAIVFIVISAVVLWFHVFRFVTTESVPLLLRLGLYLAAATTIASISRQRSESVREAEERYRSLVELSPDGIGITDDAGNVIFANTAMARVVGAADSSQLVGRRILDFAHPDSEDIFKKNIDDLRSGKEAPWHAEKWIRLDGTLIDVESAAVPVRQRGKLFFQGFTRDLTERRKAEEKLEESRRRLQALFDTSIDAILFLDSEGRVIDANPTATELLGYSREEIIQSSIGDLSAAAEERAKTIERYRELLVTGKGSGESVVRRKDGTLRELEYRAVANVLPNLHVVMMHDVTPRKDAERSLEQLSRRLLRLQDEERRRIARQLHDTTAQSLIALRLNLTKISQSPAAADPATRGSIDDSIALTDQSIAEIRTLSYLLHPPMIDEIGLIPSLRWYARGFEERSGIAVTLDVPDHLDRFASEAETAIFRIVQEALTNIQRHSGSPVARIRLEKNSHSVNLAIEDEGRGMPEHFRDHEDSLAASGVGIAGMRQRIRELGGQLEIRSQGRGTRIGVTLPTSDG